MTETLIESIHMGELFWTIPEGAFPMRRDDELIRSLLIEMEAQDSPLLICTMTLSSDDENQRRYYHLKLMQDAGLVEQGGSRGGVWRLTDAGHTAVGLASESKLWRRAKEITTQAVPQYGLGLFLEVGNQLVRSKLRDIGLPL